MRILLVCILLLLCFLSSHGKKKEKPKRRPKGKTSCPRSITLDDFEKGLNASCPSGGQLANVNIVGVSDTCRGLTSDLFIQELQCHWKTSCLFTYNRTDTTNLMLKLKYDNPKEVPNNGECYARKPESFLLAFNCTKKDVGVFDVCEEPPAREISAPRGLLRSHSEHPWLYTRSNHSLTLLRPTNDIKIKDFVYTFWNFQLWQKDFLNVTSTKAGKPNVESYSEDFSPTYDPKVISNVDRVTFSFTTSGNTGGSGFVVCFVWTDGKNKQNACTDLFEEASCSSAQKKKPRKQKTTRPKPPKTSRSLENPKKNKRS